MSSPLTHNIHNSAVIFVDGRPILPPVLTDERRKWIRYYKQRAMQIEHKLGSRLKRPEGSIPVHKYDVSDNSGESEDSSVVEDCNGCEFPTVIITDSGICNLNVEAIACSSVTNNANANDHKSVPDLNKTDMSQGTDTYSDAHTASTDLNNYLHEMVEYSSSVDDKTIVPSPGLSEEIRDEENKSYNLTRSLSFTLDEPSPMLMEYMKRYGIDIADVDKNDQSLEEVADSEDKPMLNTSTPKESCSDIHFTAHDTLRDLTVRLHEYNLTEGLPKTLIKVTSQPGGNTTESLGKYHLKFCKVSAAAKGYLTRRLLKTEKVQIIMKTIKDTLIFSQQLVMEAQSCDNCNDLELYQRIISQLDGAILQFHDIFFSYNKPEQMAIISHDRSLLHERALRAVDKLKEPKVQKSAKRSSNSLRNSCKVLDRKLNHAKKKVSGRLSSKSPYAQKLLPPKQAYNKLSGRSSSLF